MGSLSNFLVCFSDSRKVRCEDAENGNRESKVQSAGSSTDQKISKSKSKGAPIPMTYFPVGSRLSVL